MIGAMEDVAMEVVALEPWELKYSELIGMSMSSLGLGMRRGYSREREQQTQKPRGVGEIGESEGS